MAQEFFNFVNKNNVGRVGLVETEFGFHIIKVTDKDDLALIADIVAEAVPSDATSNEVFREATQFEMDSNDEKDFIGVAEKNNYSVRPVKQIGALEENLPGLPQQRAIVRWAFEDDTKLGAIRRFSLNRGGYVVVQLTAKVKEGLASVEEVGEEVRRILIKNKKALLIQKRYASASTLESLAEEEALTIETATAVNQKNPTLPAGGNEPKVVGTAFAMDEGALSGLIQGEKGVYKLALVQKNTVEDLEDYTAYAKQMQQEVKTTLLENVFAALESVAEIEDNRVLYY
jgi:peptidyl-prolyl cis-trans isomerase D